MKRPHLKVDQTLGAGHFVMLGENTYDSYILVDIDGTGTAETFRQILTIENVTGLSSIEDMIANGQLLIAA